MNGQQQPVGGGNLVPARATRAPRPRSISAWGAAPAAMALALLIGCQAHKPAPGPGADAPIEELVAPTHKSPVRELPMNSFAVAWRAELPARQNKTNIAKLVLSEDRVYVYQSDNYCYWLHRGSGRVVASVEAAAPLSKLYDAVTLADRVIFPSTKELTICSRKGQFQHKVQLKYEATSQGVGFGSTLYIAIDHPNGARLAAIGTEPQPYYVSPKWELMTRGPIRSSPAYYQELVFVGSRDGNVYAIRADDRAGLWPGLEGGVFQTGGEIVADLKADKDGVYVASTDSKLYCLDLNTGRIRWTYYAGSLLDESSTPVTTPTMVYLHVPALGLVGISKAGRVELRKPKWIQPDGRQYLATDEQNIYILARDKSIIAMDKNTGEVRFRSQPLPFVAYGSNTSLKDNLIYAATADGRVCAIRPVLRAGTIGEPIPMK